MAPKGVVEASYPSKCPVCDEAIQQGDRIAFSEAEGTWVHEDCHEEAD